MTFPSGQIDLLQVDPVPPGAEHIAVVDGTPTLVLDTAQILHGKLKRADKVVVRDVFDLMVAAELDPHALATAVNCRSPRETEVVATTFEEANAALGRDARHQLVGTGEISDPETLGTQAAAAIRGAVYRHVAVRTEGPLGIIETTTNSGTARRIKMMQAEVERKLAESGLMEHLSAGAFGAHRIRRAACRHHCARLPPVLADEPTPVRGIQHPTRAPQGGDAPSGNPTAVPSNLVAALEPFYAQGHYQPVFIGRSPGKRIQRRLYEIVCRYPPADLKPEGIGQTGSPVGSSSAQKTET